MSRSIGTNLPDSLSGLLAGRDLAAKEGITVLLLTTTDDGWPHAAMLSVGELLAVGEARLRAALWPTSTATRNLTASGQATLALVHAGVAYYVRCRAQRGDDLDVPSSPDGLAYFALEIEDILEDVVPYAELTSGITFRLAETAESLPRWQERVEALRRAR